jgi:hypothetical protein
MFEFWSRDHRLMRTCVNLKIILFSLLVCQVFMPCSQMEYLVHCLWFNDNPGFPLLQHAMRAYRGIFLCRIPRVNVPTVTAI